MLGHPRTHLERRATIDVMRLLFVLTLLATSCTQGAFDGQARPGKGLAVSSQSNLIAIPSILNADGVDATALQVTARDVYGEPVIGAVVTFTASGTSNVFSPSNSC